MKQTLQKIFRVLWLKYSRYIYNRILISAQQDEGDITYLRELSFVKTVTFIIPVSFLAFLVRIIMEIWDGQSFFPVFDIVFYIILCVTLLQKKFSTKFKKSFVIFMLYLFSLVLLLADGSSGPGTLYLISTFIFTVFLFPGNKIYYSLLVNFVIVLIISFIIYYQLFPTPLIHQYNTFSWLNYSSNLLFINLVCLILMQRVIDRLEKIIVKESELLGQLADETLEIEILNNKLKESKDYYRYLFASNPIPMWVFDASTLYFLQVNDAAINLYGYTREEFLKMTIKDISVSTDLDDIINLIRNSKGSLVTFQGNTLHLKKNKTKFPVEIRSNPIEINDKRGRLVLATDITEQSRYITNIEEQNKKLQDIAWIQSHKVRAPLARVMSLTDLLSRCVDDPDKEVILQYLMHSADELNKVITHVIKQTE